MSGSSWAQRSSPGCIWSAAISTTPYRTLEEIELRARQLSAHRIERNVHAMQCRGMLWQGRLEEAEHWMDQEPADDLTFNSLDRYCYLTRVRVYMAKERYDRATTLLTRLTQYADRTDRQWIQTDALAVIFAKNIQKEPGSFVLPGSLDAVEKISPRT